MILVNENDFTLSHWQKIFSISVFIHWIQYELFLFFKLSTKGYQQQQQQQNYIMLKWRLDHDN